MKTLELSEATASLASYAQDATNEPVIITVDGQPYVALVTANDLTSIGELSVASSGNDRLHRAGANHPTIKRHYLRQAAQRKLEQDEREFEAEVESLSNNPRFIALLERSEARAKTEGTISSEEIRRRYGLDLGGKQWQSKPSPQLSAARIAAT